MVVFGWPGQRFGVEYESESQDDAREHARMHSNKKIPAESDWHTSCLTVVKYKGTCYACHEATATDKDDLQAAQHAAGEHRDHRGQEHYSDIENYEIVLDKRV